MNMGSAFASPLRRNPNWARSTNYWTISNIMNRIYLVILFVLLTAFPVAAGEVTKNDVADKAAVKNATREQVKKSADSLCPQFAENPDAFKEITAEDMQPCEFYGGYGSRDDKPNKGTCYIQKVFGEKYPIKLTVTSNGGTCQSSGVARISDGEPPEIDGLYPVNSSVNGYGMGRDDRILKSSPFQVLVTNNHRDDLRLVTGEGVYVLCGFRYQLQGYTVSSSKADSVCEKFANDSFEEAKIIHAAEPDKDIDFLYPGELPAWTHVSKASEADLNADGKPEKILSLAFISTAGCSCSRSSLSLAETSNKASAQMNDKLQQLTGSDNFSCLSANVWSPVIIGGKSYVALNASSIYASDAPEWLKKTSDTDFPDRVLYQYEKDDFDEACRLKANTKRVIDKGALPRGALNYQPVE